MTEKPPRERFVLRTSESVEVAIRNIRAKPVDGSIEVIVRSVEKSRSLEQQALYWIWIKLISEHTGYTPDQLHGHFKKTVLLPILFRDSEIWLERASLVRELRDEGKGKRADQIARNLFHDASTTSLTTKQMAEYMTSVEDVAKAEGVVLPGGEGEKPPCPPDLCPQCWDQNKAMPLNSPAPCSHQAKPEPKPEYKPPEKDSFDEQMEAISKVLPLIAGMKQRRGIGEFMSEEHPCPACGEGTLAVQLASSNGHARCKCSTQGCVAFIE